MRIAELEVRRYVRSLDPPFRAAWDPVPRTGQDATLVIVTADDGTQGFASGDHLPDADVLAPLAKPCVPSSAVTMTRVAS